MGIPEIKPAMAGILRARGEAGEGEDQLPGTYRLFKL
jgi:hypothetical protein